MPDFSEVDLDPETGSLVPCVVCGMASQRGGTGCCSEECLASLNEAYPPVSLLDRAEQLMAKAQGDPAKLTKEELDEMVGIIAAVAEVLKPLVAATISMMEKVVKSVMDWYNTLPSETREALDRYIAREELHSKGIPIPVVSSLAVQYERPMGINGSTIQQAERRRVREGW